MPSVRPGKLDVAAAVGKGSLNVVKDMGLKEPYAGTVPLVSGEIAEDLAYYYATSEQTPSAIGLGVLVDTNYTIRQAGGYFVQLLPGADEKIISTIEDRVRELGPVTSYLDAGHTPRDLAAFLFNDIGYNINNKTPVEYYCNCSRERVEKALYSLDKDELNKILSEDKKATLHCHFCRKDYEFGEEELLKILKQQ